MCATKGATRCPEKHQPETNMRQKKGRIGHPKTLYVGSSLKQN